MKAKPIFELKVFREDGSLKINSDFNGIKYIEVMGVLSDLMHSVYNNKEINTNDIERKIN